MSHIPNSAMPHASADNDTNETPGTETTREKAAKLAGQARDKVMENPKTAIAAGVAVAAAAVAAAAIPLVKAGRKASASKPSTSKTKKS